MSRCRSCKAPVVWAETEPTADKPGRRMPLDGDPDVPGQALSVANGNVAFTGRTTVNGTPIVRIVAGAAHRAHFVTCPDRDNWRRP